jgi:enterochelin esterase family protein
VARLFSRAVTLAARRGPLVGTDEITFRFSDPTRSLTDVALAHELRRPRRVPFQRGRRAGTWTLEFRPGTADRVEYLLELTQRDGETRLVPDPANPLRAAGPFGEKSVVELPSYLEPDWVSDDESPPGEVHGLRLPVRGLRATVDVLVWSPADADPDEPLPLLIAHDGPEYAEYSQLVRFLDHAVAFGDVPPLRAALIQPVDRNDTYSASARYARAFTQTIAPALVEALPTDGSRPVAMGASLGALAALHAHWQHPRTLGALFLQSGSFFRERWDKQEAGFARFARIARFVGHVLHGRAAPPPVPTTVTVGTVEENLDNNRAVARALEEQGWEVRVVEHRDAHNWVSWRDTFDPHLPELLMRAWS